MDDFKSKKRIRLISILLAVNLLVSFSIAGFLILKETNKAPKYILYIGTNDKDTYTQEIPLEEARNIVNAICAKYVDGYTALDAKGGWVDETDTLTQEDTLVYIFFDVTKEQLNSIMDEILEKLNQNSILVERQEATYMYYSGK